MKRLGIFSNLQPGGRIAFLSLCTAFSLSVYILEAMIPKPLPFFRLGLANIIILVLLWDGANWEALGVGVAKTILGGLFLGTLLSPGTLMSLSGTIVSILIMRLVIVSRIPFSLRGVSIIGALFHNLTQLAVVRLIIVPYNSIFCLTPVLIIVGIATGIVTGVIAGIFYERISRVLLLKADNGRK
ncbi:MAG: Gx transporter family protein [Candidatus Cloacimonetes bacterium]|nr:Gx transporter family protein [Candidatus Cloacimonadota bacterium]